MRVKKDRQSGFTLLEIVISITLLALIALMMVRVFNASSKTIGRGQDSALLDESARLILDYLEQDICQALVRTNIAFQVDSSSGNGMLYCISPAVRKLHDDIARDTAPIRFSSITAETGEHRKWNLSLIEEVPDNATGNAESRRSLIYHSNYYHPKSTESIPEGPTYQTTYASSATGQLEDHATLTFLNMSVNGDSGWDDSNPDSPPRFVDISIGLISSVEMKIGLLKEDLTHIRNNEQCYSRRIYLYNRAPERIPFNNK